MGSGAVLSFVSTVWCQPTVVCRWVSNADFGVRASLCFVFCNSRCDSWVWVHVRHYHPFIRSSSKKKARELIAIYQTMCRSQFLVLSASSSTTPTPTSSSSSSQDSVFDLSRYTENPVPERSGSMSEELRGNPLHKPTETGNKNMEISFTAMIHFIQTLCTAPIPVEFDRSMSVSLLSSPAADVDMRVSSKRGIVEVESEPSWVASFIEDANERRIEHRMDERLDANERRTEQVLGLHQTRLDKHDTVAGRPSVGNWALQEKWRRTEPTVRRFVFGHLVRCWLFKFPYWGRMVSENGVCPWMGPFWLACVAKDWSHWVQGGCKRIALLSASVSSEQRGGSCAFCCKLPDFLWYERWWWLGFSVVRFERLWLLVCSQTYIINVRGHSLKVSIELSPRRKTTLSNMFRAESFLKKSGVNPESFFCCVPRAARFWARWRTKTWVKLPRVPMPGCGIMRNVLAVVCRCPDGKTSKIHHPVASKDYRVSREKCELCVLSWNVQRVSGGLSMLVQHISELEEWDALLLQELSFKDELLSLEELEASLEGHKLVANVRCPWDTAIVVHCRWMGAIRWFASSQYALWVGLRAEEEFTFCSVHLPSWVSDDCFEQSVEEVLEAGRSKASGSIFLRIDAKRKNRRQ